MRNAFGNIIGLLVLLSVSSVTGISQSRVELGVRGGIPFNDACQSQLSSSTRTITSDRSRYTVGPTIRTRLTEYFAVQLDALYMHSR
jgi:hypothetical protein